MNKSSSKSDSRRSLEELWWRDLSRKASLAAQIHADDRPAGSASVTEAPHCLCSRTTVTGPIRPDGNSGESA